MFLWTIQTAAVAGAVKHHPHDFLQSSAIVRYDGTAEEHVQRHFDFVFNNKNSNNKKQRTLEEAVNDDDAYYRNKYYGNNNNDDAAAAAADDAVKNDDDYYKANDDAQYDDRYQTSKNNNNNDDDQHNIDDIVAGDNEVCAQFLVSFLEGTTDARDTCEGIMNAYTAAECASLDYADTHYDYDDYFEEFSESSYASKSCLLLSCL